MVHVPVEEFVKDHMPYILESDESRPRWMCGFKKGVNFSKLTI